MFPTILVILTLAVFGVRREIARCAALYSGLQIS